MNLDVFRGRDVQLFVALLNLFEGEGVTDIRFVRQKLQEHMDVRGLTRRTSAVQNYRGESQVCPSCGKAKMVSAKGVTDPVLVCPACRYSEYSEVV